MALIGCLLLPSVWGVYPLRLLFLAAIVVGIGGAAMAGFAGIRKRDRYDLGELQRVHDRAAVQVCLDDEPVSDSDTIVCRACGTCYAAEIGVCPECGCIAGQ